MSNILVTGATGHLGSGIARHLARRVSPSRIFALAREPLKAAPLTGPGVTVRQGDYADPASLLAAFAGIDTLIFVSTTAFSDAFAHHRNVVTAARKAGVRHIFYTGIQRREGSSFRISQVSDWERETERLLADSGLAVTILRNAMYFDTLPFLLGDVLSTGRIAAPAGTMGAALAAREDLAEATALLATTSGHEGRTYDLGGSETVSMAQIATILSETTGTPVSYEDTSVADYVAARVAQGLPQPVAGFMAEWLQAIAAGAFLDVTGDLEAILGRKPLTAAHVLPALFAQPLPA